MFEIIIKQPGQDDALGKLAPGVYIVGSALDCPIQFDEPGVSGHHVQLNVKENSLSLVDLDSSNGTYVDEKALTPHEEYTVDINSVITIGDVQIVAQGPEHEELNDAAAPPQPEKTPSKEDKKELQSLSNQLKAATSEKSGKGNKSGKENIPLLKISGIPESARPLVQEIKKNALILNYSNVLI